MSRMTFLGVDLGTSALKAVLVDEDQATVAQASVPLRSRAPRPGWSEQDPHDWWTAFGAALADLRDAAPKALRAVKALGLSGQMHGAVVLDRSGAPIRPAILWNDGRATRECEMLAAAVADVGEIAGVLPMPGFTAPKLLWLKTHEPENFARIAAVVSPKDFLRLRLTGETVTDMSDAAGTLWLDQARRDWSDAVLAASGLSRASMPRLVEGSAAAGEVREAHLDAFRMEGPVVVAGGAGDAAAAAVGIGAIEDGDAFISLGTSAQFFVTDDRYRPQPELLLHAFAHALPKRWFRMAAMLNAAACLEWVARLVGETDIARLLKRAEAEYQGPSRLLFLPYLSGERTPHNDSFARGVYCGIDHEAKAADLVQATLEGVAFSLVEARQLLAQAGVAPSSIAAVGGGAQSAFWMRIVAHCLGIPVVRYRDSGTGPAFGAARLARLALASEPPADICRKPDVLDVAEPDAALTPLYAERFETYRALYRKLRPEFRRHRGL